MVNFTYFRYNYLDHTESDTKWATLLRWHPQMHFRRWKIVYFDTEVCSYEFIWQVIIHSAYGRAPNMGQAIIGTNYDTIRYLLWSKVTNESRLAKCGLEGIKEI